MRPGMSDFDGRGVYGLNRNVDVTILVAKDGKVRHNSVFPAPVFVTNPHVLGAIAKAIGEERQTVAGWFRE